MTSEAWITCGLFVVAASRWLLPVRFLTCGSVDRREKHAHLKASVRHGHDLRISSRPSNRPACAEAARK
jgi:hypothetical protein